VTWDAVSRYADDLGIIPLEVGVLRLERGYFDGSDRCPVEWVKGDDKVLTFVIAEFDFVSAEVTGKLEIGSCIADFERLGLRCDGGSAFRNSHVGPPGDVALKKISDEPIVVVEQPAQDEFYADLQWNVRRSAGSNKMGGRAR